ncbi:MAG: hypothetical protein QM692_10650 [Thermomicrobiales bacterium]
MRIPHLLAGVALVGALVAGSIAATAQDSTSGSGAQSAGVTRQPLTAEAVSHLEGMAGPLTVERLRIPASAGVTMSPADGALVVVVVESGSLEGSSPGIVTIQRKSDGGAVSAQDFAADQPFTLGAGDVLVSLAPDGLSLVASAVEPASVVQIGIGSDRPLPAASTVEGVPSGLVMALSLVVPPACPPGTAPEMPPDAATPLAGGGGGGSGAFAVALAAAPACVAADATPIP